jgi:hypothetical protein
MIDGVQYIFFCFSVGGGENGGGVVLDDGVSLSNGFLYDGGIAVAHLCAGHAAGLWEVLP